MGKQFYLVATYYPETGDPVAIREPLRPNDSIKIGGSNSHIDDHFAYSSSGGTLRVAETGQRTISLEHGLISVSSDGVKYRNKSKTNGTYRVGDKSKLEGDVECDFPVGESLKLGRGLYLELEAEDIPETPITPIGAPRKPGTITIKKREPTVMKLPANLPPGAVKFKP